MKTSMILIGFGAVVAAALLYGTGCSTAGGPAPEFRGDCDPWTDNSFFGPSRPNPNWRHTGALQLGDVKAKRLAAKRILKAPPGWDCPEALDNSEYCTPLENQGQNPWCAAYSMAQLLSASYWREYHVRHDFNEGSLYRIAKSTDGSKGDGTTLDAIISAALTSDLGVPYSATIPEACDESVFEVEDVLFAIHKYGLVMVGMQITEGWNDLNVDGTIGPRTQEIGGHAVLVSGYSKKCNRIWGPNWWGKQWGRGGWWMMTLEQFEQQFGYGYAVRIVWEKKQ